MFFGIGSLGGSFRKQTDQEFCEALQCIDGNCVHAVERQEQYQPPLPLDDDAILPSPCASTGPGVCARNIDTIGLESRRALPFRPQSRVQRLATKVFFKVRPIMLLRNFNQRLKGYLLDVSLR